jgi:hypothetical protein
LFLFNSNGFAQGEVLGEKMVLKWETEVQNNTVGCFYECNDQFIRNYLDLSYNPNYYLQITEKIKGKKIQINYYEDVTISEFDGYSFIRQNTVDFLGQPSYRVMVRNTSININERLKELKGAFRKQLIRLFPDYEIPHLLSTETDFGYNRLEEIISLLKHEHYFKQKKPIYYDENWEELKRAKKSNAFYSSKVDSFINGIFFINNFSPKGSLVTSYTLNLQKPRDKNGWHYYYNGIGILNTAFFFNKNSLDTIVTFHGNGKEFEKHYPYKNRTKYHSVKNIKGESILTESGAGEHSHYDSIQRRTITKKYQNYFLLECSASFKNQVMLLSADDPIMFKFFNKLVANFEKEFKLKLATEKTFKNGLSLIKCIVDVDGRISKAMPLKSMNPENDYLIASWLVSQKSKTFLPSKKDNQKSEIEIIIPVQYDTFYKNKYRGGFNYYYFPLFVY